MKILLCYNKLSHLPNKAKIAKNSVPFMILQKDESVVRSR